MSDELVKRLRGWDHCWPAPWLERAVTEAADRIEQLTGEVQRWQGMFDEKHNLMLEHKARAEAAEAERDEAINQLDSAIHSQIVLEKRTAAVMEDRKFILEERDRTFALMLARTEKAEAEVLSLREVIGAVNNEFGSAAWNWPDPWKRVAQLKELSNDRWKRAEAAEAERDRLRGAGNAAAMELRVIAGMDLMGASATAWNAARKLEAALKGEGHE